MRYCYYELLVKLHLLLVANNLRKAYFDETTLISCKYFENCSDGQVDDIIIAHVPAFRPKIDALNQVQKVCKRLELQTYLIRQIPIEVRADCKVPENVVDRFVTSFRCGKQILVFNNNEVKSEIAQLVAGKLRLGDMLEYPKCCVDWMANTKTKSLEECYEYYVENRSKCNHEEMMKFLYENFERDSIPGNIDRMFEINYNHVKKTISAYPFVFHQACASCLKSPYSPTAKLNKIYEDFAKKVSKELHQDIFEARREIVEV